MVVVDQGIAQCSVVGYVLLKHIYFTAGVLCLRV